MELYSYPRTLRDILKLNRKYIIPRFQREYSWGEDELSVLWKDIISNITYENNKFIDSEYFIGSLVLVGDDTTDTEFYIVDGQQRLTTITIFFAALSEVFKNIDEYNLMNGTHKYVEALDDDNQKFLILISESPKPFFQFRIQQLDKDLNINPKTDEEQALLYAYNFFMDKLEDRNLQRELKRRFKIDDFDKVEFLKVLRSQVLSFKTIYITVKDEDDAYLIFETLNAKGKDLESIDLIKNRIFKLVQTSATGDFPREMWKEIRNYLYSRENKINMTQFLDITGYQNIVL